MPITTPVVDLLTYRLSRPADFSFHRSWETATSRVRFSSAAEKLEDDHSAMQHEAGMTKAERVRRASLGVGEVVFIKGLKGALTAGAPALQYGPETRACSSVG